MPDKMRIVYIIDQLNIGGTEKQLLAVIERLDRTKFELYLVCLRPSLHLDVCVPSCQCSVLHVNSLISRDGFLKLVRFSRFLQSEKIDIVQTFFFDSTVFGVLAARLAGVKRVISCRRDMGFWYTPKLLLILRGINKLTDRILVNSFAIKENVICKEHVNSDKIDVIYNGLDLAPFTIKYDAVQLRRDLGIPGRDQIVGIVANLNRLVKRVDLFIDAAAQILRTNKDVSFIVVGDGHLRKKLEEYAYDLGTAEKIHFVRSIDNITPYLQLFDIGVLTSESEGFANAILEYMAAGLPVVCFDSGGNNEIITNDINGYVVAKDQCFGKILLGLLGDERKCRKLASNNLKSVQTFCWGIIVKQLSVYYAMDDCTCILL